MRRRHRDSHRMVKRAFGLCLLGASLVLVSQACGSEDAKKKAPPREFTPDGGEGGGDGTSGTNTGATSGRSAGGTSGDGAGGESVGPIGGTPNMTGDAGATSSAGAGGIAGDGCEPGFGNCDADPDCEQDLTSVNTCGGCNTSCSSANGDVVCEDLECKMTSCNANYGDCNTDGTDGCETNLLDNADNCGECGRDCATLGASCSNNRCSTIPMQQAIAGGTDGARIRCGSTAPMA